MGTAPERAARLLPALPALLGLIALAALGCAGRTPPPAVPVANPAEPQPPAWEIPAAEVATQRLLRAELDTPRGGARLRITLRLAADGYQLLAADVLGRPVWTLHVAGGRALFLDHRAATWCETASDETIRALPLGAAPLAALPAVLLGRLPLAPQHPGEVAGDALDYRTVGGGRLTADLRDGQVQRWTLWIGDEPSYWWARDARGALLTARREGLLLRWEEVVREPLPGPLVRPAIPPGARQTDCDEPALP